MEIIGHVRKARQVLGEHSERLQSSSPDSSGSDNPDKSEGESLTVVLLIIIAGVVILILIILIVYIKKLCNRRADQRRITPSGRLTVVKMENNVEQYQSKNSNYQANPKNETDSMSRFSTESDRWSHPTGQIPEDLVVPEPAYYTPPDESILKSIPRPSTSIRTKLKDKYEIDLNDFVSYIRS
ncbi:uncharacterized protein LOC141856148 [Brevipalpus obovatus]|uniref:uncharacterized protein LOC141856148 n=1 Tax=Brevipalpus obovatus TaxID=246614 RepID=UPI003D9E0F60